MIKATPGRPRSALLAAAAQAMVPLLWAAVPAVAAAQPAPTEALRIGGQMELGRLVDLAAARHDVAIQYPEDLARRKVLVRAQGALTDEQLWSLTQGLLLSQGLVTIEIAGGHGLSVVPTVQAQALSRTLEPGQTTAAGFQVRAVEVEHASPATVEAAVRALLTPQVGSVRPIQGTRRLLLADHAARLDEAMRLLRSLDVPGAQVTTARVPLSHTPADRLVPIALQARAKQRELSGAGPTEAQLIPLPDNRAVLVLARQHEVEQWRALLASLDAEAASSTRVHTDIGFDLDEVAELIGALVSRGPGDGGTEFRVVQDRLTGSLIVTGSLDQHLAVEAVLERLRAVPAADRNPTRVFTVHHRDVGDVAAVLSDLIDVGIVGAAPPQEAAGGAPDAHSAAASRHQLVIDAGSNSIYVSAPTRVLDQIQRLLPALDVRLPQVQVEVMLVSLSESQARDLGVELQHLLDDAGTLVGLSSLFGLGSPSINATNPLIGGAGGTAVVLDPGDFSVVVRALETVNRGRTLSMPKVLVNNNEDATIDSVLQQPFISTNASDTVATTSFGGFEDAGTQVTVTPQITAGDHLVLRYSINLSSFVGEAAGPESPPPRQQNSISSVATIPDGFTVVVGGIELQTQGYGEDRVPLLGEVPLLGNLFKTTSRSGSRQRFFAFIRATVMRDQHLEELKHLSEVVAEDVGIDDGWPKVEPRVIR